MKGCGASDFLRKKIVIFYQEVALPIANRKRRNMRIEIKTTGPDRRGRGQVVLKTQSDRSRTTVQCNRPEPEKPKHCCDVCSRAYWGLENADLWLCDRCLGRAERRLV